MQIKFFTIPIIGGEKLEDDLNAFLRSKKILHTENQLVSNAQGSYWCICITYLGRQEPGLAKSSKKEKLDYKEILSNEDFKRFDRFREIRKGIAQEEGLPVYAVFTNAELAEIAKLGEDATSSMLKKLDGIGKGKADKYGIYFVAKGKDEKS